MGIEEFENHLKSKLVQQCNDLGIDKLCINTNFWRSLLLEEKFAELLMNTEIMPSNEIAADFYKQIIDIAKLDSMCRQFGIDTRLSKQLISMSGLCWGELHLSSILDDAL